MKQPGSGVPLNARMLECAIAAAIALLAADVIGAALRPFRQTLRLLFGI